VFIRHNTNTCNTISSNFDNVQNVYLINNVLKCICWHVKLGENPTQIWHYNYQINCYWITVYSSEITVVLMEVWIGCFYYMTMV